MVFRRYGLFVLGIAMMAGSARGSTTYNTATAFNTDTSALSVTTITFTNDTCSLCASVTDGDTTFNSIAGGLNIGTVAGWPDGNTLKRSSGGGSISISSTDPIYAFGLNIVSISGGGFPIDVLYNDGTVRDQSLTAASNGGGIFFGVMSATPLTGIQVVSNFNQLTFAIDDVEMGTGSATPETSTMFLIGLGLITIHLLRRRQKQPEPAQPQAADRCA